MIDITFSDEEGFRYYKTGKNKIIYVEDFEDKFGDSYNYNELINHKNVTDGWKVVFEEWKQKDILK